jgi:hypothetical protein
MEKREDHKDAVLAFYSNLSRMYVSAYATAFTIYAAFIAFFYVVLLPKNYERFGIGRPSACAILAVVDISILAIVFLFVLRTRAISRMMTYIEKTEMILKDGRSAYEWFFDRLNSKLFLDRMTARLFYSEEESSQRYSPLEVSALLLFFGSLLISVFWIFS